MAWLSRLRWVFGIAVLAASNLPATPPMTLDEMLAKGMELGHAKQFEEAMALLLPVAQSGNMSAQFAVGSMYSSGMGVPQSKVQARIWLEQAAVQGHPMANFNLGIHFDLGLETDPDPPKALAYYRRAAELGNAEAAYNAGSMLLNGEGAPISLVESFSMFEKAADAGLASAQNAVAFAYWRGFGVPVDLERALTAFDQLAQAGDRLAEANIGELLRLHLDQIRADEQAGKVQWATRAYAIGCRYALPNACVEHGRVMFMGVGRPIDYRAAYKAFNIACNLNLEAGCDGLAYAITRAPESAADSQFASKRFAAQCQASNYQSCHALAYMKLVESHGIYDWDGAKKLLGKACSDGGNKDSCNELFAMINAEVAARGPIAEPARKREISGLSRFLGSVVDGMNATLVGMAQASQASGGYQSSAHRSIDTSATMERARAQQDARDFQNYIRRVDSNFQRACRPGNPYC